MWYSPKIRYLLPPPLPSRNGSNKNCTVIGGSTKNCTMIGQLIGDAVLRSAIRQFQPELGKLDELGGNSYKYDCTD